MDRLRRLGEVLQALAVPPELAGQICAEVTEDSRLVQSGDVFFDLIGSEQNLQQAADAGALLLVTAGESLSWSHVAGTSLLRLPQPRELMLEALKRRYSQVADLQVLGVTGTNGKTSVAHLAAQLSALCGVETASIGTLGVRIYHRNEGQAEACFETTHTTAPCSRNHQMLQQLADQGVRRVIMEVSSHGLDQGRLDGISFDAAAFTNLSRDHLDYHGTMQRYAAAKRQLFDRVPAERAILNLDDATARQWLPDLRGARSFGLQQESLDLCARVISCSSQGQQVELLWSGQRHELIVPLLGRHNLSNLMAALLLLQVLGLEQPELLEAVAGIGGVPGRLQQLHLAGAPLVVVDYAHTPDALEQALLALRAHCRGALWCIAGCGGDRDAGKRPIMGEVAARLADQVCITDDNPRSEDPESIAIEMLAGCRGPGEFRVVRPREAAIRYALGHAARIDSILLAGKGHETYQEIAGVRLPYSDPEVVAQQWQALQGVA